jgi:hypothetical protein
VFIGAGGKTSGENAVAGTDNEDARVEVGTVLSATVLVVDNALDIDATNVLTIMIDDAVAIPVVA